MLHFQKYVEGPALLHVQGPKVSMLATDTIARAAVLYSVVENVPIGTFHEGLLLEWYAAVLRTAAQPFVLLGRVDRNVVHALSKVSVDAISYYTASKITKEFAEVVCASLCSRLKNAVAVHFASDGWEHHGHHFCGILAFVLESVEDRLVRNVYCLGLPVFNHSESRPGEVIADFKSTRRLLVLNCRAAKFHVSTLLILLESISLLSAFSTSSPTAFSIRARYICLRML